MARQNGWTYSAKLSNDAPMDFGDEISIEEKETCEAAGPRQQADYEQLKTYIQTLFRPDETVWYCTKSFKGEDGKYRPSGEHYHMKAGDMLRQLDHYRSLPEGCRGLGSGCRSLDPLQSLRQLRFLQGRKHHSLPLCPR